MASGGLGLVKGLCPWVGERGGQGHGARNNMRAAVCVLDSAPTHNARMDRFLPGSRNTLEMAGDNPQHPRKSREPPPGHAFNVYKVTDAAAQEYATTVMGLDKAGALALFAHVQFLWETHSEWEQRVEKAIQKDRRTGVSPDNKGRPLWDCDELLWISTQRELAKLYPNSTPKDLRSTTQEGYFSMMI
jgi:hypothetical protein